MHGWSVLHTAQRGRYLPAQGSVVRMRGVEPYTGERCWSLQAGTWWVVAPFLLPWCAGGEVLTAANLNLYGSEGSHVAWNGDSEELFGLRAESKLMPG